MLKELQQLPLHTHIEFIILMYLSAVLNLWTTSGPRPSAWWSTN